MTNICTHLIFSTGERRFGSHPGVDASSIVKFERCHEYFKIFIDYNHPAFGLSEKDGNSTKVNRSILILSAMQANEVVKLMSLQSDGIIYCDDNQNYDTGVTVSIVYGESTWRSLDGCKFHKWMKKKIGSNYYLIGLTRDAKVNIDEIHSVDFIWQLRCELALIVLDELSFYKLFYFLLTLPGHKKNN